MGTEIVAAPSQPETAEIKYRGYRSQLFRPRGREVFQSPLPAVLESLSWEFSCSSVSCFLWAIPSDLSIDYLLVVRALTITSFLERYIHKNNLNHQPRTSSACPWAVLFSNCHSDQVREGAVWCGRRQPLSQVDSTQCPPVKDEETGKRKAEVHQGMRELFPGIFFFRRSI